MSYLRPNKWLGRERKGTPHESSSTWEAVHIGKTITKVTKRQVTKRHHMIVLQSLKGKR